MSAVKTLEKNMSGWFKSAPALPKNVKQLIVQIAPWSALAVGLLQLFSAWGLGELLRELERLGTNSTAVARLYNHQTVRTYTLSSSDRMMMYLAIIVLIVDGAILVMAFSELKKRSLRGWELAFLAMLVNAAYADVALLVSLRNFDSFLFSVAWSIAGFYLLFQVRDTYSTKKS